MPTLIKIILIDGNSVVKHTVHSSPLVRTLIKEARTFGGSSWTGCEIVASQFGKKLSDFDIVAVEGDKPVYFVRKGAACCKALTKKGARCKKQPVMRGACHLHT